jgi:hypothetical protein
MPIELAGQGEPLPADFPYEGEWILRPRMFLYVRDEPSRAAPTVPQFTVSVNTLEEDWSFGFDAGQLAAAFNVTTDALREANRRGELTLENVLANTLGGERATQKIYVFGYKGKIVQTNIELLMQVGRA